MTTERAGVPATAPLFVVTYKTRAGQCLERRITIVTSILVFCLGVALVGRMPDEAEPRPERHETTSGAPPGGA